MVVGSIYCDKIVHTKMHLLSTTWQTCIDAYSRASLKSNRALIYRIEGTETVNFTMLKGTIFVGYQNKNFLLCAKLPYSSNFPSRQNCVSMQRNDDEITIHWRSFIIVVFIKSKKEGKDQKSIQSSTTPDQGQHNGKEQKHNKTPHTREPRDQPFPSRWPQYINSIRVNAVLSTASIHRLIRAFAGRLLQTGIYHANLYSLQEDKYLVEMQCTNSYGHNKKPWWTL